MCWVWWYFLVAIGSVVSVTGGRDPVQSGNLKRVRDLVFYLLQTLVGVLGFGGFMADLRLSVDVIIFFSFLSFHLRPQTNFLLGHAEEFVPFSKKRHQKLAPALHAPPTIHRVTFADASSDFKL